MGMTWTHLDLFLLLNIRLDCSCSYSILISARPGMNTSTAPGAQQGGGQPLCLSLLIQTLTWILLYNLEPQPFFARSQNSYDAIDNTSNVTHAC